MRYNDRTYNSKETRRIENEKAIARKKWAERQFDKWVTWSINVKGKIKYKDIIFMQKELNIIK